MRTLPHTSRELAIIIQNLVAFAVAAILEIFDWFTFGLWLRRGASPAIAALGILSLVIFCLVVVGQGQQPTTSDMLGAGIAVIGALVIVGLAART